MKSKMRTTFRKKFWMETLHSTEIGEHCRSDSATPIKRRKSNEDTTKCDIDPSEYQNDERNLDDPIILRERNVSLCLPSNRSYEDDQKMESDSLHHYSSTKSATPKTNALSDSSAIAKIQQSAVFESRHISSISEVHQSRSQAQDIQEQVPSLSESCTIEVVSASTTTLASVVDDFLANAAAVPESRPVQEIQQSEVFESQHISSIYEMHQSRSQAQDIQEQQLKQFSGDFETTKQTLETGCIQ